LPEVLSRPPHSVVDPVTDIIHGVTVTDPYRWLEEQDSPRTRQWLQEQNTFAREYLDGIPGRDGIRARIEEFLQIETYDSLLVGQGRYFFRKRLPYQEQPCIYMREGRNGEDRLLVDPADNGSSQYTAVKPIALSPDGNILAYEVKEGGERAGRLEFFDVKTGNRLPDSLPKAYLRAFAFAADSQSFFYSQDPLDQKTPFDRAIHEHKIGKDNGDDITVFNAGQSNNVRLGAMSGPDSLIIFVYRFSEQTLTDIYLRPFQRGAEAVPMLVGLDFLLSTRLVGNRMLVLTDKDAPNLRIAEFRLSSNGHYELIDLVPASDAMIQQWIVLRQHLVVSYLKGTSYKFAIFDLFGEKTGEIPLQLDETAALMTGVPETEEIFYHTESFFESGAIHRYSIATNKSSVFTTSAIVLDRSMYTHKQVWYRSKDGTNIPMFLVGRRDVLERKDNPAILTSYGGFKHSMTPQFSVFVAFLMEKGCVFALPNIRGGSEFGAEWHAAAKRHHRQRAFDDFLSAAEWLIDSEVAGRDRIAIFGGSNSGLLVGVALTQAPSLFRAVVCNAPLLDMLRYHLFDGALKWKEEFGTANDLSDFEVLWSYSPYQRIVSGGRYPAVMMISGDSDQRCNPLHARKMVAALQAANISASPIILDYSPQRGHTPVLPLSTRVHALTDRMAFLCDQLRLNV
jgi:prolyl oligopeptidase